MSQEPDFPPAVPPAPETQPVNPSRYKLHPRIKHALWQGKFGPAFWTISSIVSLTVNVILIVILVLVGRQLFTLKDLVSNQLVNGLYQNFQLMDQAHITTSITVSDTILVVDTIPVVFNLPLEQDTTVILTRDTKIPNTWVALDTFGTGINLSINAPADITLPEGTPLDIHLSLVVPVSQTLPITLKVPINLKVPVDIALNQTQLHEPFVGLQQVVAPYHGMLSNLPDSWRETPLCGPGLGWVCKLLSPAK